MNIESNKVAPLSEETSTNESQSEPNLDTKNKKMIIGVSLAVISAFCYVAGLVAYQRINDAPPDFQLNSLRFITGSVLISVGLIKKGIVPKVSRKDIKWLAMASVGYISFNLLLYKNEIRFLPIGTVGSLFAGNHKGYSI